MRIENYLGFPTGLTGSDLAERAVLQANKFGAVLSVPAQVTGVTFNGGYSVVGLEGGESLVTKCLLVATGADYRRLEVEGCARFEGSGVFYAATQNEVQQCRGANVVVVGGGNSAGQAAVFLAGQASQVFILIRGDDLYKQMSTYLARRIEQTANIEVLLDTSVERMLGDGHLSTIDRRQRARPASGARFRSPRSSASSAPCRGPTGFLKTSRPTPRASSAPVRQSRSCPTASRAASRFFSRRAGAAFRRRRCPRQLGQARGVGRRRGIDGDPVRARVPERDVSYPVGRSDSTNGANER